ncbi:major facilitator superfamily domain-containing protein 6-A-like [Stegodyphus dumicola]|uniref:major facilitator superfamily domain-containing protein 6-A-like n=1 Tax=Stegodyphus dumicola TaxID=202533 RepID=UPI0015AD9F25|nr:major facilitator superfamily domain-containing protein 6-A-like [Stegodyphus dumicola]XP_035227672.1 major facilitator superfamily domain-containing protein 6-A-like [Stegodyphus dumicola]
MADATEKTGDNKACVVNGGTVEAANAKTNKKFWSINKETLAFKFHFFLFIGAFGAVFPYLTIFAQLRLGINASSLALALTIQQFCYIVTKLLISYIVDYLNKLKQVIVFLILIQGVCLFLLLALPPISSENKIQTESDEAMVCKNMTHQNISPFCLSMNLERFCEINKSASETIKKNESICHNMTDADLCTLFCNSSDSFPASNNSSCLRYVCTTYINSSSVQMNISTNDESRMNDEYSTRTTAFVHSQGTSSSLCCCDIQNGTASANKYGHECCNFSAVFDDNNTQVQPNSSFVLLCKDKNSMLTSFCCRIEKDDTDKTPSHKSLLATYQFWVFLLILMISGACVNALFTLSDTACYESIQKTGADFGQLRLWGAFGWGIIAPFAGFLNDYTGDYVAAWCVMAVMCAVDLCIISKLDLVKPEFSKNILKDVGTVFRSKEFLIFELGVLMNGIGTGIVWFYLVWFLTTIGGTRFLAGLTQTLQCFIGEIPFMFFSGWIIKRIGYMNVLTLALMGYCVRFFWYSNLYNPWLVLPIECMHGFTYGIFYAGVTAFGKLSAKPGTEATTQAIVCSTHEGLGAGLGCVIAGIGFDYLGAHRTFFYAGIFTGCGMLINIAFTIMLQRRKKVINVTSEAKA